MNKLYLVILALCTSIYCMNLAMDAESESHMQKRDQIRALIIQKTKEKEQQEFNKREKFLCLFGQESINRTGELFRCLSLGSKQKVASQLSYNQNLLVWFGAQGLDIPILTILCNGNENVAHIYRNEPINKVLGAYAQAKEMNRWVPIDGLYLQHYMVLKNKEINILADVTEKKMIYHSDLLLFMKAIKKLKEIDPEGIKDIREITDPIKMYPSCQERALLFWNTPAPVNKMLNLFFAGTGIGFIATAILTPKVSLYESFILPSEALLAEVLILGLWDKYKDFCIHFENNVLPNQPTLADVLKKQAS